MENLERYKVHISIDGFELQTPVTGSGVDGLTVAYGTITALEIDDEQSGYLSELGPTLLARFREAGLLLRPLGNTIYVMPPYCIDDADLDQIYAAIADAAETLGRVC